MSKTVVVIDDHPLFRKGVADLLEMEPQLQLIAEAADGQSGLQQVITHQPDIVLLDINMRGVSGLETLRAIKQFVPHVCVVMLTVSDQEEDIVTALRHGASGYLLKDMEPEETLKAIVRAGDGELVVSPQLSASLAHLVQKGAPQPPQDDTQLTPRELEISELISHGMSNKLIARQLDIALTTVKAHVKNIHKKLHLSSRTEVAIWYLKHYS